MTRRRAVLGGMVVALVFAAVASSAVASTVFVTSTGGLGFTANPGEANRVTVFDRDTVTVEDTAGLTAGAGCRQQTATVVTCPEFKSLAADGFATNLIDLGDGDDFYHETSDLYRDDVNAGPGDDEIFSSRETDTIRGQEGDDRIHGGGGDDKLDGGPGDDTIIGSSGNDMIFGGTGRDMLAGDQEGSSDGNDTISAQDGEADRVSCDNGTDLVTADQVDTVDLLCEDVRRAGSATGTDPGPQPAARCRVPKVRGLTLAVAQRRIRAAGCATRSRRVRHRSVRKGRVVGTTPAAGRVVRTGTVVTILVSRGRR